MSITNKNNHNAITNTAVKIPNFVNLLPPRFKFFDYNKNIQKIIRACKEIIISINSTVPIVRSSSLLLA